MEELLEGEEPSKIFNPIKYVIKSRIVYGIAYMATKYLMPRLHSSVNKFRPLSTEEYIRHRAKVDKLKKSFS